MSNIEERLEQLARADHTDPPAEFLSAVRSRRSQRRTRAGAAAAGLLLIALAFILIPSPNPAQPNQFAGAGNGHVGPRAHQTNLGRAGASIPVGLWRNPDAINDLAGPL